MIVPPELVAIVVVRDAARTTIPTPSSAPFRNAPRREALRTQEGIASPRQAPNGKRNQLATKTAYSAQSGTAIQSIKSFADFLPVQAIDTKAQAKAPLNATSTPAPMRFQNNFIPLLSVAYT